VRQRDESQLSKVSHAWCRTCAETFREARYFNRSKKIALKAACYVKLSGASNASSGLESRLFGLRRGEIFWLERRHIDRKVEGIRFAPSETKNGNKELAHGGKAGWRLLLQLDRPGALFFTLPTC
jgi:hypothetical protein